MRVCSVLTNPLCPQLSPEDLEKVEKEGGSYTGMAAILADALKERRKHFAEKRTPHLMCHTI